MDRLIELYYKYKYYILGTVIFIIILFIILIIANNKKIEQVSADALEPIINDVESTEEEPKIKIDIKGEVINPGVYELNLDARVIDAIKKSGGLTNNADTSMLNLSKKLKDENVVIVYNKEDVEKLVENTNKELPQQECICPKNNDACISKDNLIDNEIIGNNELLENIININKANIDELQLLTGIGKSKAEDIIDYREENGPFNSIEDIKNVKGIGDALFDKIKEDITV